MQLKRTTSQTLKGSKFERKTKSLFKPKFGNKGHICVVVAVAILVAKGPYSFPRSISTKDLLRNDLNIYIGKVTCPSYKTGSYL